MGALSNQSVPYAGTQFAEGVVLLTVTGGSADGVPVGLVQDFTYDEGLTHVDGMGAGSQFPVVSAVSHRKVDIKVGGIVIDMRVVEAVLGGSSSYDGTSSTTFLRTKHDIPSTFKLKFKTPTDGSDETMIFNAVRGISLSNQGNLHTFVKEDLTLEALPDSNGNVYTRVVPGNQTVS